MLGRENYRYNCFAERIDEKGETQSFARYGLLRRELSAYIKRLSKVGVKNIRIKVLEGGK